MSKHRKHRRKHHGIHRPTTHRPPPGAIPGSLMVHPDSPQPVIHLIGYGPETTIERAITDPEEIREHLGQHAVTWINVDGLGDAATLEKLGRVFELHPLSLADVVNVHQRPKVEPYENHLFLVTRMMMPDQPEGPEQISVFVGKNYVLSFQERRGDLFDPIRDRIRNNKGRVRHMGPDYLSHLLLDAVIDGYFPVLDVLSERLEVLENETVFNPQRETVGRLHTVKRELLAMRRSIWPQREAINSLLRDESPFVSPEAKLYFRDAYDHAVQIIDIVETYRELASGLMEVYLSSVSNRMNEVMKVLTIIATIFIPLTFVAGVYGMNFDPEVSPWNMPELNWYLGYPASLLVMAAVAGGMLLFFRRKGWIGSRRTQEHDSTTGNDA